MRHPLGKGEVIYIGVDSLDGRLEMDLLWSIYDKAGVKPARLPLDFLVDWRDGFWVATNFTSAFTAIPAPPGAKILIGQKMIPPGGVAVWQ